MRNYIINTILLFIIFSSFGKSQTTITIREICIEDCANGSDDDNDGLADCADTDCQPSIVEVIVTNDRCGAQIGDILIEATGSNLEYTLTDGTEVLSSDIPIFFELSEGQYTVGVRNTETGCSIDYPEMLTIANLCEICDSGLDDDLDGDIDCDDTDCLPVIRQIDSYPEICGAGDGSIAITADGQNLNYILNGGASQPSPQFSSLASGAYVIEVINAITGCSITYPYEVIVESSCEILANGIDDDGDGDVDCEDSEHYAVIRVLNVSRASQEAEDGIIEVEADGRELSFVIDGTYELVLGDIRTLNQENTTGVFTDLPPGQYTLTVTNGVSMCTAIREIGLNRLEEICGNDLDDDGDGFTDCQDETCMLAALGLNAQGEEIEKSNDPDPELCDAVNSMEDVDEILSDRVSDRLVHCTYNVDDPADGVPGFITRREKGAISGRRIAQMIQSGEIPVEYRECIPQVEGCRKIITKIDLVAHSMGYAYALGVMDGIKEDLKDSGLEIEFDRFYILAPENACSTHGTLNIDDFSEVWQYGSRRGALGGNDDPFVQQDGVAPQCAIIDFPDSRRAYIPPQSEVDFRKGFLNSHSEGNYGWIFERVPRNRGYVTPK